MVMAVAILFDEIAQHRPMWPAESVEKVFLPIETVKVGGICFIKSGADPLQSFRPKVGRDSDGGVA